ncbi:sugar transferase [Paludibaculum fermentans]|uniref:sugar transferase n=1 Tax=Paludibaculum fermentans TaxID=1473598 RepID=UPI003EB91F30
MSASTFSLSSWKSRNVPEDLSGLDLMDEEPFLKVLNIEQKRTERSGRRFVLLLMQCAELISAGNPRKSLQHILDNLDQNIRATDITGWYKQDSVLGIIFTELGSAELPAVTSALHAKVSGVLSSALGPGLADLVTISFHVFPEDWVAGGTGRGGGSLLESDPIEVRTPRKVSLAVKRGIDVAGSLTALILLLPVMAVVAAIIKITSPGPVLFKQLRVGRYGRQFSFWKFRSMVCNNNSSIHEEFVKKLIAGGKPPANQSKEHPNQYKLADDPRITPIGRFIRRASLDELPQFFNVLIGDMSLVGPRPPIPYEVNVYSIWHRRRLLAAKPGITGLWQVKGRSRVGFDDMVRLDLKYASSWSLWLDVKIILQTPRAVFGGEGAR